MLKLDQYLRFQVAPGRLLLPSADSATYSYSLHGALTNISATVLTFLHFMVGFSCVLSEILIVYRV